MAQPEAILECFWQENGIHVKGDSECCYMCLELDRKWNKAEEICYVLEVEIEKKRSGIELLGSELILSLVQNYVLESFVESNKELDDRITHAVAEEGKGAMDIIDLSEDVEEDKEVAEEILSIPLGNLENMDSMLWARTKNGCYKVNSAYHIIKENWRCSKPSCSNAMQKQEGKHWRSIWKLMVPPKVKIFIWKDCANALPSLENLQKRRIDVENVCHNCCANEGDLPHIFRSCPLAQQMWALSNLSSLIYCDDTIDVKDWVSLM